MDNLTTLGILFITMFFIGLASMKDDCKCCDKEKKWQVFVRVCQGWVKNGGACNYGCDNTTGMCNCKVPTGRFIRTFGTDYLGSGTSDMKTGYHWTDATMLTLDFASAQSICTQEAGMVFPSLSDIQKTVIIQQSPATHCRPDIDITLFNADDRTTAIWTSTPDYVNGGYFTINIQTGEVDTAQVTESRSTVCVFTN